MNRIPVLLLVRELGIGGTERQTAATALALDRNRFEPHVGCFRPAGSRGDELRAAGIPIVQFPVRSFASVGALTGARQLMAYVKQHNIRIVHSFDTPMNIFAVAPAKLARTPVVLTSQRAFLDLSPGVYGKLLRTSHHLAHGIVVNCEAVRKELVATGFRHERIHLCYNGLDTRAYPTHERTQAADTVTIGLVCAFRKEKSIETLLDAFALLRAKRSDATLLLVGSGPHEQNIRAHAAALGIDGGYTIEPATADVASVLRRIDIFVLPSLSEAFSNSLMEAMASGCCPVATNIGGNPELVEDGKTGLLFEPGDAPELADQIERLIEDPRLRASLASAAAKKIHATLTLEDAGARMGEIYESMLAATR